MLLSGAGLLHHMVALVLVVSGISTLFPIEAEEEAANTYNGMLLIHKKKKKKNALCSNMNGSINHHFK